MRVQPRRTAAACIVLGLLVAGCGSGTSAGHPPRVVRSAAVETPAQHIARCEQVLSAQIQTFTNANSPTTRAALNAACKGVHHGAYTAPNGQTTPVPGATRTRAASSPTRPSQSQTLAYLRYRESDFFMNLSRTLPALWDDFNTERRAVSQLAVSSEARRQALGIFARDMVLAVSAGIHNGTINPRRGYGAISAVMKIALRGHALAP